VFAILSYDAVAKSDDLKPMGKRSACKRHLDRIAARSARN